MDEIARRILTRLDENERVIVCMQPAPPMPEALLCRESPHRTLGHLTACQHAWLPLMRALHDKLSNAPVPKHPNKHFEDARFAWQEWSTLLDLFRSDRAKWRDLVSSCDLAHVLRTRLRTWDAVQLVTRLVDHERLHLVELGLIQS